MSRSYAGFCRRTPLPACNGRSSISGTRCRAPLAVYPQARAGRPRTLAVRPCSRWGLPSHSSHLECWWSLTPPFHPYPDACPTEAGWFVVAVCFLWHCPAGCPGWPLTITLPCGARTFLGDGRTRKPGTSASTRPSDRLIQGKSIGRMPSAWSTRLAESSAGHQHHQDADALNRGQRRPRPV